MSEATNKRILLVDDSPSIHEDFRKILGGEESSAADALADARAAFFGGASTPESQGAGFDLTSAYQGQEALEVVTRACESKEPFAMAFVDVRMPPGWDGVKTIKHLWEVDDELQVVICTAYSDYSWEQTIDELGQSDRLLILKKPFDSVEIRQLAGALTAKWNMLAREKHLIVELQAKEAEARAYSSSLETTNRALITAKASADKASEMKSEFLVHLSNQVHENLSTILAGVQSSPSVTGLEPALDASRHLMRTLDGILDLTLIETRNLTVHPEPCHFAELVEQVIEIYRPAADKKELQLDVRFASMLPETVECDPQRARQVLGQLVENAIQNTSSGRVLVDVALEQGVQWGASLLRCSVTDTGCGIPDEMAGRLYEPFSRAPGTGGSAGLGLAVCKQIAGQMGGDVHHDPNPDGGTIFTFTLDPGQVAGTYRS